MLPFGGNYLQVDRTPLMMPFWPSIPSELKFNTGTGEVVNTNVKFTIILDVSQFKPSEIEINLTGRVLSITAKHEERSDEHGSISRSFTRKYSLPDDVDLEQIRSKIVEGKLMIEAAKMGMAPPTTRSIPITIG